MLPRIADFLRLVQFSSDTRSKSEFVSEVFLTSLANICLSSADVTQKVFKSDFLGLFICNNFRALICKEQLAEPFLFLVQNVVKHFDDASASGLQVDSKQTAEQLMVFFRFMLDFLHEDDRDGVLSEDLLEYVMRTISHLLAVPSLKCCFGTLYRDQEKLGLLVKKLTQCLYNSRVMGHALFSLNKLASHLPVEEYSLFRPAKLAHAMTFVLKMTSSEDTRKDSYFLLSNLMLNYPCLKVLLANQTLFERAGLDFINSTDELRLEIAVFLGNTCFGLEPEMVGDLLENRVLEILQIGLEFDNLEVAALILESFHYFFGKFEYFQDRLRQDHLEHIMKFANDQHFIDQLDHFDQSFYQRADSEATDRADRLLDVVNKIYELRVMIGIEKQSF